MNVNDQKDSNHVAKTSKTAFWDRMDDVHAGLLTAEAERAVPMSPYADRDENAIWFITAGRHRPVKAADTSGEATFPSPTAKANLYANRWHADAGRRRAEARRALECRRRLVVPGRARRTTPSA